MPSPGTSGGRVRVYIDGDAADLERAIKQSNSALARLGVGQTNLSTKTKLANAVADQQRRNLSAIATGAKYAAGGLAVFAGAGLAKATADGIRFNAEMESSVMALGNFIGSTKETQKYVDELFQTAKETPFQFADLVSGARRLMSFGLAADKTKNVLDATGDAIAAMGGGQEQIDRVTLALGQMQAKGKASAEELLQMSEAGIPAYKILQEELGLTGEQVANIGNEGISANKAIEALTTGMEKRFSGAAEEQAKTWDGLTSTMSDNWAQMTGAMTADLFDEAKQWAPKVNETMEDLTSIFERQDLSFEEKVQKSIDAIDVNLGPLADEIGKQLDDAELGNHLIDAIDWAIPRVAENAGQLGLQVAEGLVKGFIHADPLGKLFIAASITRLVAGNAGFSILGSAIAGKVGGGIAAKMPATIARGVASVGGWGPVGAGIAASIAVAYEAAEGPLGKAVQAELKGALGLVGEGDYFSNVKENLGKIGLSPILDDFAAESKEAGHAISAPMVKAWIKAGDISEEQGDRILDSLRDLRNESQGQAYVDFSTTNKVFQNNLEAMHRGFYNSMASIRKAGRETSEEIESELGKGSAAGRRALAANYRAMADNVDRLVERQVISTAEGEKRKRELIQRARLVEATEEQAQKMGKAWTKGLTDQEQFTKKHVSDVLDRLQKMPPAAANVASKVWLGQLRIAAQNNPKLQDEFRDLRERIVDELGIAAVRGTKKSRELNVGVGGNFFALSDSVAEALGLIGTNADSILGSFGADKINWKAVTKDPNGKSLGRQMGGSVFQVPGTGTGDSFHTAVPPGTFILNRNAVNEFFGLQRGGGVPVVLEPGELAFSPEAVAQMGGWLQWANGVAPRFAGGGSVAMPGTGVQRSYPGVSGDTDFIPALGNALSQMARATGTNIGVQSGFRTFAEQAALQGGPNPAAPPGSSHHEYGYAADITPGNEVFGKVAGKYGLTFPLLGIGEPWHIELSDPNSPAGKAAAAVEKVARVMLDGPDGPLKNLGQAAADKAWKAANAYIEKKAPAMSGPFPKGGSIDAGKLPPALQKWNKRFPGAVLQNDPRAWAALPAMPFNEAAALAEWAGMPGVTFAQVSKGEGALKPGSMGDDNGDGKPDGYGWLAVTRPYGDAYGIDKYGGYEGMLNPVSNAIISGRMYRDRGYAPWYGIGHVTDWDAHYSGPLLGKQRGGFVGMAGGGVAKPTTGGFEPGTKNPPAQFGPGLPTLPPGINPGALTYEQKMSLFGIQLVAAQETEATDDDLKILLAQQRLIQKTLDDANAALDDLHLTDKDKQRIARKAAAATEGMQKKFMEDGKLSRGEQRQLEQAEKAAMRKEGQQILSARRADLIDQISGLTGEMSSTKDAITSLNEDVAENLTDLLEAVTSLADEMAEHNRILAAESTTQRAELIRAMADLIDGEIGGRVDAYSNTAGYGQVVAV